MMYVASTEAEIEAMLDRFYDLGYDDALAGLPPCIWFVDFKDAYTVGYIDGQKDHGAKRNDDPC